MRPGPAGIAVAAILIASVIAAEAETPSVTRTVTVQGRERSYLLHVPAGVTSAQALPLVLVFHGGTDTPANMEKIGGFSRIADREGFIVAYPAGIEKSWNDGRGTTPAEKLGIDDVAFVKAVIADIERSHGVDFHRVYATGPSNGGLFSSRLGCEMTGTFAGIGPVIGTIAADLVRRCHPAHPISVIGIQGTKDPLMPFAGGQEGGPRHLGHGGRIEGGIATQLLWAQISGCSPTPVVTGLPVKVEDRTSVTKKEYGECRDGTSVVWYEIEGGGHRWPPHHPGQVAERLARRTFGISSQNIDASDVIWEFFKVHPRRER